MLKCTKEGPKKVSQPRRFPETASIIIPCRNEGNLLQQTIDSIFSAGLDPRFQVIVVDDGSTDQSSAFLAGGRYSGVNLQKAQGLGVARARNAGAALSSGDLLIFCDAHTTVSPGWLERLLAIFTNPQIDAACTAIGSVARPQDVGYGGTWDAQLNFRWLPQPGGGAATPVPFAPGGCIVVRRHVFEDSGGFQHQFRVWGYEDQEFSLRLWLFGYSVFVCPAVTVLHHFRQRHPYHVSFDFVDYNLLWMAFVHFNQERISKTAGIVATRHADTRLLAEIMQNPAAHQQRALYHARRKRDDDWFMRQFGIPF